MFAGIPISTIQTITANLPEGMLSNFSGENVDVVKLALKDLPVEKLTKVQDVSQELVSWENQGNYNWTSELSWNIVNLSTLMSIYVDRNGTYYGWIHTTYNANINALDETDSYNNFILTQALDIYRRDEIVVLGFTFKEDNETISIPDVVIVDDKCFEVKEIWCANIYDKDGKIIDLKELVQNDLIPNIPALFNAPSIEKITLKRKLNSENYSALSGVIARQINMPNLRKVVGAGEGTLSPVFSSLNGMFTHVENLNFPNLKVIKNCIFASNDLYVKNIELPELEELHEVIFCKGNQSLKNISLPKLWIVQGCDFFLANCYNLEQLHWPNSIRFMPHDIVSNPIEIVDGNNETNINALIASTVEILGLDGVYPGNIRYNGTNAMSYFLHGDVKLMNGNYKKSNKIEGDIPPYDTNVNIIDNVGIYFDFSYKYPRAPWIVHAGSKYGLIVETLGQLYNRIKVEIPEEFTVDEQFEILENKFCVDKITKMIVIGESEISKDSVVIPIDPRTSLLNNLEALPDRNTRVHVYTFNNSEFRFVEDSCFYVNEELTSKMTYEDAIKNNMKLISTFFATCMGTNQYYRQDIKM